MGVLTTQQKFGGSPTQVQAGTAQAEVGVWQSTDRPGEQMPPTGCWFEAAQPEGAHPCEVSVLP